MKKRMEECNIGKGLIVILSISIIMMLVGCGKKGHTPEDLGEIHFNLYFDVLSDKDVDGT